ncbi:long-chain-fatty-acid--CoA ligase 5-like isoform X2 [Octopus vulgaris]|uniref:Long-chain-fatty-acid--CoA ligase n=1 Tax=Octopus vulgaris TaxID=6645 RepID=A0AA36AXV8_OCTVU|nr:long-chain-fatty-acid--CoA ligase 5-like isoform X2 [Octopus vulgaris]
MDEYLKYVGAGSLTVAALAAAAVMLHKSPEPYRPMVDLSHQSAVVEGREKIRKSVMPESSNVNNSNDVTTLYEAVLKGASLSVSGKLLGWRPTPTDPYTWLTYNDVLVKSANVGAGLIKLGQNPSNTTHIGIYSQNNPEFFIVEQACYMYSMVLIPLYDTLGPDAATYIVNQAEISLVVCDKNSKLKNLLKQKSKMVSLKTVVLMEAPDSESLSLAKSTGVKVVLFEELEKLGEENPHKLVPCKSTDVCIICYTSGTTGIPKGAILTHKGMLAAVIASTRQMHIIGCEDVMISYLPLAHVYERFVQVMLYIAGGSIGFFSGDVKKLMDDIKVLRPTIFPSVPRLLNRLYDKILEKVNSSKVKQCVFNMALSAKASELERGILRNNSWWDKLIFREIQKTLGGRTKLITTGSAPLSPKVLSFLRCVFGCMIIEGYGQTETHGVCTLQHLGDMSIGVVGPPLSCSYIKLADIPEMNYFADNNKGEICVKGDNIFSGYFKNEEKTQEVFDSDGWLHTGDVGEWLPNGTLKIIDRKKNIFKLSQGEYIAPEKIENIYIRSRFVAQIFIHGDSLQSCLVGICVPDEEVLSKYAAQEYGLENCSLAQMAQDPRLKEDILDDVVKLGKEGNLNSFEQVKSLHLHSELMTIENGLLTPTMKMKRQDVAKYFHLQIENMYNILNK